MGSHIPMLILASGLEAKGIAAVLMGGPLGAIFIWTGLVRISRCWKEGSRAIGWGLFGILFGLAIIAVVAWILFAPAQTWERRVFWPT